MLFHPEERGGVINLAELNPGSQEMRSIRGNDIAMIFQEPMNALSPVHTVGNQIIEALKLHNEQIEIEEARSKAASLLDDVGLPNPEQTLDSYTFELSGGMRQRAMIAMALSCDPELLIADEPTTALDVTIQAQILELIKDIQNNRGMSIMNITHYLAVVAEIATGWQ